MNYIQQAYKGLNHWWRYLVTILLVILGWQLVGAIPLLLVAITHSKDMTEFAAAAQENFMNLGIDSNLFLVLMILMFVFGLIFLFIGIKSIHKRKVKTLITSRKNIDWKRVFFAFGLWFSIGVIMLVVSYYGNTETLVWNFKPLPFLVLVLISFLFLPLQTSFEELLFRGYLMQGLGILAKNRWIPLFITSVAFGLLHGMNPEVDKLGYTVMVFYIGTGFLLGILTLMDEGTELALGFHAANNIVAAVFVTQNWTVFQTEALYIDNAEPTMGYETYIPVFILYPIVLFIFSKKYHWTDWSGKLFGKVEKPKETTNFFKEESFLEV